LGNRPDDPAADAIRKFHDAALQPKLWPAALQKLADAFRADGCVLLGGPNASLTPIWSASLEEKIIGTGRTGTFEESLCVERLLRESKLGRGIVSDEVIVSSSVFDHQKPAPVLTEDFGLRWFAAIALAGIGPNSIFLKMQRCAEAEPFFEPEIHALRSIRTHLGDAVDSALRFAASHHVAILEKFSAYDFGAVLLDLKGRVLRLNGVAERLLGSELSVQTGYLRARTTHSDVMLQKLIRSVTAAEARPAMERPKTVAVHRPAGAPLLLHAARLPQPSPDRLHQASSVVTIIDRDIFRGQQITSLRQMFNLTKSEAEIAVALARGHDTDEIAAMRRVSIGTLRVQLRSIFTKTNTRRQSELVALILSSAGLPR